MQPTASGVHIDSALTNISQAYIQSADSFIASRVFPVLPVTKQSDKFFIYTKNDWFRDEAKLRAPATESAGSGYNLSTDSYLCDVYALHKDVPDQVVANADMPLNPESDAARFVAQRMLLKHEIEWTASFFAGSVWTGDVTGGTNFTQWSNYVTSTPILDIQTGRTTILQRTGFEPNTLVLGYEVYAALINHPDIIDRLKYTSSETVAQQTLARLLGVDRLFVASAVKATNIEGETAAYGFVHGKAALLCYVAPNVGPLTPTAGVTFAWRSVSDGTSDGGSNVGTVRIEIPETRVTRIESQMAWDSKVIGADLGQFYASAVA